jgi:hypothetical protein
MKPNAIRYSSPDRVDPLMDPLVAAIVAKLPVTGAEFPREAREAWLRLMAGAFDMAYGVLDQPVIMPSLQAMRQAVNGQAPAAAGGSGENRLRPIINASKIHIAADGTACNADGVPVLLTDVPPEEIIFDTRPIAAGEFRDLAGIVWADGQRGTTGIAAGVSFCGPG